MPIVTAIIEVRPPPGLIFRFIQQDGNRAPEYTRAVLHSWIFLSHRCSFPVPYHHLALHWLSVSTSIAGADLFVCILPCSAEDQRPWAMQLQTLRVPRHNLVGVMQVFRGCQIQIDRFLSWHLGTLIINSFFFFRAASWGLGSCSIKYPGGQGHLPQEPVEVWESSELQQYCSEGDLIHLSKGFVRP